MDPLFERIVVVKHYKSNSEKSTAYKDRLFVFFYSSFFDKREDVASCEALRKRITGKVVVHTQLNYIL